MFTTQQERTQDYLRQLRTPYTKLCRLRFLQPDGTTAFVIDNNPLNRHSGAFIQSGSITRNLQNGQRASASVTLANLDGEYDYNVNHIWFGQQIAIDEGLILSDGSDYYIQQGVFYIKTPSENITPSERTITFPLVDKWAYLDGTLFGVLESTYEVPVGDNIFAPISALLSQDKGNGQQIDSVVPIFTEYYNDKTQELPNGDTAFLNTTPYTLTIDAGSGTLASVILGLNTMVNGIIGYDANGALRLDASQDDILDDTKPILWQFGTNEASLVGLAYSIDNASVYNDYIVVGEQLDNNSQPAGRAENLDPSSSTNINLIGRKTYRYAASDFATKTQCRDFAEWQLKRAAVLQKSVSISCIQMFHIFENNLVTIMRTDKKGSPIERHLIQGFTRPLTTSGAMTINATSVNDYPIATLKEFPLTNEENSQE